MNWIIYKNYKEGINKNILEISNYRKLLRVSKNKKLRNLKNLKNSNKLKIYYTKRLIKSNLNLKSIDKDLSKRTF